jgi:coenzyme F420-reducing hydrogenase alpha subunit
MVVRSLKTQSPELIVLEYTPGGVCELVESTRRIEIVKKLESASQIVERLDELSKAFVARARERRYTQSFKEKHYDFLRKFVELKARLDRAVQS